MVRKKSSSGAVRTPVTVITGFLGAGKTTLVRSLLAQGWRSGVRLGVVVNDLSDLDVDGVLLEETDVVGPEDGTLACITGRSIHEGLDDLAAACTTILDRAAVDHLLVETSGSTRPGPVVRFFSTHPRLLLHGFIVVVDAAMARDDLDLGRAIRPRSAAQLARGAVGTETVLAEQIAFASDIYLTKTDRIADGEVDHLVAAVHALNPAAAVSVVRFGNVRLDSVLSLPAYDVQAVRLLSRQIDAADRRRVDSDPIVSLVLDDPRPFHPGRLWDAFTTAMPRELHRSKGFTWLPSRDDQVLVWNQAAGGIGLEILGYWRSGILAHVDNDLTAEEIAGLRSTVATGDAVFGDRRTQITLIGPAGPAGAFLDLLGSCLLTPDEVDRWAAGGAFEDPWPTRRVVLTLPAEADSRG